MPPRVVFAGTPEFAAVALSALQGAGFEISLVLTQPDRPAGRGMKLQASPVKQFALAHGIEVFQPATLRLARKDGTPLPEGIAAQETLRTHFANARPEDVMVVAAYGLILPPEVLEMPPRGCINIHASLLPRWRGAAPIHRAVESGDASTGVTLMQMDAGLDTGAMLLRDQVAIAPGTTTGELHDTLAAMGARLTIAALNDLDALRPVPQPEAGVTYAAKVTKEEASLDFSLPAEVVARRICAFNPAPGASTTLEGELVKCWRAIASKSGSVSAAEPPAGKIVGADAAGVVVRCGDGESVSITELQRAGGKRVTAREFVAAHPQLLGKSFQGR
jgi:methionyl-tRNA formyltransferase